MANEHLTLSINISGDEKATAKLQALDRMLEQTRKRAAALNPMRVNIVAKLDDRITGPARRIQNLLGSMAKKPIVVAVSTKGITGVQTALRSLTKGPDSKQFIILSVVDKATAAIRGVWGQVKDKMFTLGVTVSTGAFAIFRQAIKLVMEWEQQAAAAGKVPFGETFAGQLAVIKGTYDNLLGSFGKGILEAVKPRLAKIVDWLDQHKEKVEEWKDMLTCFGKEAFDGLLSWGEDCLKSLVEVFKDPGFQKLSWGDKVIYLLGKMLDAMNAWIAGPGGKKVEEIFVKLAEIATRAWLTAIGGMMKGSVKSLSQGNFFGAAGLAAGANALSGGLLLRGVSSLGKGLGNVGKEAYAKGGGGMLSRLGSAGRFLGRLAAPIGIGLDLFSIANANKEERAGKIGGAIGRWGGMLAGAKLGAAGGAAIGTVVPGIGTAVGGAVGGFLGGIAGLIGGGTLGEKIGVMIDKIDFSALQEKTIKWIKELPDNIAEHLGYMVGYAVEKLSQLPGMFGEWFAQARDSAVQWVMGLPEQIAGIIESIPERISSAMQSIIQAFIDIGQAIPKAIENGFNFAINSLSVAGKWIVDKAMAGVEAANLLGSQAVEGFNAGQQAASIPARATGGIFTSPHIALFAEEGPEAIIPLSARRRSRALSLWQETGRQLGVAAFAAGGFSAPLAVAGAGGGTVINLNFDGMIQSMTVNATETQNVVQEVVEVVASSLQSIFENQGRC